MKKIITALVAAGITLSFNSYALTADCGTCGYTNGFCAPKFKGGFYLGITGAWLQPSLSGIGLNDLVLDRADENSNRSQLVKFHPDYDWEWGATVGYDFACSPYNIEGSYLHLKNDKHNSSNIDDDVNFLSSFFIINLGFPVGTPADATTVDPIVILDYDYHSQLKSKFNQADIKFGRQYNDVCGRFQLKPSIGIRYAQIKEEFLTNLEVSLFDSFGLIDESIPLFLEGSTQGRMFSDFHGIGPMFALDARYGFCGGFGIVGHFDAALLIGDVDSGNLAAFAFQPTTIDGVPVGDVVTGSSGCNIPSAIRTVRNLDGKVGIDYTYCFCNRSSLTVEVGYQASSYANAVDFLQSRASTPGILIPAALDSQNHGTTNTVSNDFEFHGPYVNVIWHM